jgi:hypothetical protein
MAIAPERTFKDTRLCIYPESLDNTMKERLEERYNLAYSIPNEKIIDAPTAQTPVSGEGTGKYFSRHPF